MKKDDTKRRGSIDPRVLINTGTFITVMGFPGLIQIQGLASRNINIYGTNIQLVFFFLPSILYFTR